MSVSNRSNDSPATAGLRSWRSTDSDISSAVKVKKALDESSDETERIAKAKRREFGQRQGIDIERLVRQRLEIRRREREHGRLEPERRERERPEDERQTERERQEEEIRIRETDMKAQLEQPRAFQIRQAKEIPGILASPEAEDEKKEDARTLTPSLDGEGSLNEFEIIPSSGTELSQVRSSVDTKPIGAKASALIDKGNIPERRLDGDGTLLRGQLVLNTRSSELTTPQTDTERSIKNESKLELPEVKTDAQANSNRAPEPPEPDREGVTLAGEPRTGEGAGSAIYHSNWQATSQSHPLDQPAVISQIFSYPYYLSPSNDHGEAPTIFNSSRETGDETILYLDGAIAIAVTDLQDDVRDKSNLVEQLREEVTEKARLVEQLRKGNSDLKKCVEEERQNVKILRDQLQLADEEIGRLRKGFRHRMMLRVGWVGKKHAASMAVRS